MLSDGSLEGLHLGGPLFEPVIERNMAECARLGVARLAPGHCTDG